MRPRPKIPAIGEIASAESHARSTEAKRARPPRAEVQGAGKAQSSHSIRDLLILADFSSALGASRGRGAEVVAAGGAKASALLPAPAHAGPQPKDDPCQRQQCRHGRDRPERRDRFGVQVARCPVPNRIPREAAPIPNDKLVSRLQIEKHEDVNRPLDRSAPVLQSVEFRRLPRAIPPKQPNLQIPLCRPGPRDAASPAPLDFIRRPMTPRPNRADEDAHHQRQA
jgi:hypothetical protein